MENQSPERRSVRIQNPLKPVMKFFRSKHELINIKVLDQIGRLIDLRTFLTSLRKNEIRQAIAGMELSLDCVISAMVIDAAKCDVATKELMKEELKRLWLYRNNHPEDFRTYLAGLDHDTAERFSELRARVERILEEYSHAKDEAGPTPAG